MSFGSQQGLRLNLEDVLRLITYGRRSKELMEFVGAKPVL